MHPFLTNPKRLAGSLAVWLGVGLVLCAVLTVTNAIPLKHSLLIVVPPLVLFSFECLASWFLCRALPLRATSLSRALASQTVIAFASGVGWVSIAAGWWKLLVSAEVIPEMTFNALHLPWWIGAVAGMYLLSSAFFYVLIAVEESQRAEQAAVQSKLLAQDAELRFLRTQIDPHFLFNSLNSISALTTAHPADARGMTLLLGDFLRASLQLGSEHEITLAQELELVRQFCRIEQVRFGSRLRTTLDIDPRALACKLPPLLIQPLVENAVKHGIGTLVEGGTIAVSAKRNGTYFSVRVQNSFDASAHFRRRGGVGLTNVRQRLQSLYGSGAQLSVRTEHDTFVAELTLPAGAS